MTTITLGPEGTFSHELTKKLGCTDIRFVPTIHSIITAVARGEGDGIAPIENSEAGAVGETLDGLSRYPVYITAEMYMPIHHHLASQVPLEQISVIYAHPQTHEQCSNLLESWQIPVIHTTSNAASALESKKNKKAGAIIPALAAAVYDVPIILRHVENNHANTTRFVRLSRAPGSTAPTEKCSILIDPSTDRSGLLHDLLDVFARRKINLTRIESRPSKRGIGNYVFFLDYAFTSDAPEALSELKALATVKELGCYRRLEVPQ
jgi:prephenate dehydratase